MVAMASKNVQESLILIIENIIKPLPRTHLPYHIHTDDPTDNEKITSGAFRPPLEVLRFGGLQVQGRGSLERLAGHRGHRRRGALAAWK